MCLLSTLPATCPTVVTASDSMTGQSDSQGPVFLNRQRHGVTFRNFLDVSRTLHSWSSTCEKKHCLEVVQSSWGGGFWDFLLVTTLLGTFGSAHLFGSLCSSFQIREHLRRAISVGFSDSGRKQSSREMDTLMHECHLEGSVLQWRKWKGTRGMGNFYLREQESYLRRDDI